MTAADPGRRVVTEGARPARLLVVTANLKKALPRYLRDDRSLHNFARRVADVVPGAPDVLLLQEVVEASAQRVAELVSKRIGFPYTVVVAPGADPVVADDAEGDVVRNAAIVLNTRTLNVLGAGGYVRTSYSSADARPGTRPRAKEHPHCLAEDVHGTRVALASVHLVTSDKFAAPDIAHRQRARWASELAAFMRATYRAEMEHGLEVVGGDFNTRRCRAPLETSRCRALPFWRALAEHGYADAVYERHASSPLSLVAHSRRGAHVLPRIDFLFVRGRILDAASDRNYDARATDPGFYSDHRLVWAVVASRP